MDGNNFNNNNDNERELIESNEVYKEPKGEYVYREEARKKRFKGSFFSYIAIALVSAIIGGLVSPYIGLRLYGTILPSPGDNQYTANPVVINPQDDYTTVSAVAKKSMGSVVGITTTEQVQQYFWFMPQTVKGVGTGVIVDSNGYILTNSHVVIDGSARSISVLFENGEKEEAELLWNEPEIDLAIVKVNKTGLPVAELGDSDKLIIGEVAIAIGNPLGLEFQRTVTSGIVSGLNRSIQISQDNIIQDLIQTDASINNGNSGGPLLNSKGQVIGINTAKIQSGEGLGFSIPINEAKAIIEQVVENGKFETVFLGISGVSVDDYQARLGVELDVENGVILVQVSEGTPADRAGLLNGDIITKIDDIEIDSMIRLKKSLYRYKKGDRVDITIIRNNQKKEMEVEFTEVKGAQN